MHQHIGHFSRKKISLDSYFSNLKLISYDFYIILLFIFLKIETTFETTKRANFCSVFDNWMTLDVRFCSCRLEIKLLQQLEAEKYIFCFYFRNKNRACYWTDVEM